MLKDTRREYPKHLAYVRSLPCTVCRERTQTEEAAHVRMKDPEISKLNPGHSSKPHDFYTVPLCLQHHRDQHAMGEREFWDTAGIDPVKKALALYAHSGDVAAGERIIQGR
jgi:hypothetical protein